MAMTLHVVIPPHPLIGHWLSILRIETTPPPIYSSAFEQIGKWLTYEALRDWLPNEQSEIKTERGLTNGILVKTEVPILVIPNMPGGLHMWQGAREILPNSVLCLGGVPKGIEATAGIVIFYDQIESGNNLLEKLIKLKEEGVSSARIRVITAVASTSALKQIGEIFPELTIYAASIDQLDSKNAYIVPGIGVPSIRLNTRMT